MSPKPDHEVLLYAITWLVSQPHSSVSTHESTVMLEPREQWPAAVSRSIAWVHLVQNSCSCFLSFCSHQFEPTVNDIVWATSFYSSLLTLFTCALSIIVFLPPSALWCGTYCLVTKWAGWLGFRCMSALRTSWAGGLSWILAWRGVLCVWLVCVPGRPNAWELPPSGKKDPMWSVIELSGWIVGAMTLRSMVSPFVAMLCTFTAWWALVRGEGLCTELVKGRGWKCQVMVLASSHLSGMRT